jgi:alginate O-acetyltransferase complex protein AlgJ
VRNSRRLDQLTDFLKGNSNVPLIDLRNALRLAKSSYPLYYKLDTHWNAFAGFVAYQEIMKELVKVFSGLSPLGLADFEISTETEDKADGDLVSPLAMYGVLPEVRVNLTPRNTFSASKKIPKVLVFHDSFIQALSPYMQHDFETVVLHQHREMTVNLKLIESEKPDVVIFQVAERFQHALLNDSGQ